MKTSTLSPIRNTAGSASGIVLMTVLIMVAGSLLILSATMRRTWSVSTMNDRNNQFSVNANAAEAAVEKVVARMSYDFQNYGLGQINASLDQYRTNIPSGSENEYWRNFQFTDGQGNNNRTFVLQITNYTGPLPSQYPGRTCVASPVYRVLSNAKAPNARNNTVVGAVQVDLLAALVPVTQWAIFYNGLLEFSSTATMTINGPVHANGNVYTGSDSVLTLNGTVTTTGTQTSPANNGHNSSWSSTGVFNGSPKKSENVPTVNLSIGTNMASVHQIIEMPAAGVLPTNSVERSRLYNLAQVILLVSNTSVTLKLQAAPSAAELPGNDSSPIIKTYTNLAAIANNTNLPFLTLTNSFTDQRENKTTLTADIDINRYRLWIASNPIVTTKISAPTILFVANNKTYTATQLPVVRLNNGKSVPVNGNLGFTLATPNPLYVKGHYNCPVDADLGTTNTANTMPAALMSDALTILSANWTDSTSASGYSSRDAADTTLNAAILTGTMPSTGTLNTTFSGGVHNLPRMLEDWQNTSGSPAQKQLTLNTSILSLFASKMATNQFRNPGNFGLANSPYYDPPKRQFSYDLNFRDYAKTPPGMPTALVLIRKDWAMPPPNKVNYYASP